MKIKQLLSLCLILLISSSFYGQSSLYVEGRILDAKTKKPVPFATIRIQNKGLGLYASEDGGFSFRMRDQLKSDTLIISSIGYHKITVPFNTLSTKKTNILYMKPALEQLEEISIISSKRQSKKEKRMRSRPKSLIREAIRRIPVNYPEEPFKLTSYYRDYLKRNDEYYNLNEAIVQTSDNGFKTLHFDNKFRLMYYQQNKNFPRLTSIPEEYDSIWQVPNEFQTAKKFIPYAKIPSQGGNELFILLAHDPVRNYKTHSFSFIYRLSVDFLKNHTFKKHIPVFKDDRLFYKVEFGSEKVIQDAGRANAKMVFPGGSSHYVVDSSGEKVSDAVIVKGEIYINPEDFTIHKLNYKGILKSTMKKIYGLSLEYGYADESETLMRLKYVSFNNEFFAMEESNMNDITGEEKNVFQMVSQKRMNAYIQLTMNAPVDIQSAENMSFYKISTQAGNNVPIRKIKAKGNEIHIYPENRLDLNNRLNIEMNSIRDVDGRVIDQKRVVRYYQYREFFVQEFDQELEFKKQCFMGNVPLKKNCISRSPNLKNYLINSPLSNDEVLK